MLIGCVVCLFFCLVFHALLAAIYKYNVLRCFCSVFILLFIFTQNSSQLIATMFPLRAAVMVRKLIMLANWLVVVVLEQQPPLLLLVVLLLPSSLLLLVDTLNELVIIDRYYGIQLLIQLSLVNQCRCPPFPTHDFRKSDAIFYNKEKKNIYWRVSFETSENMDTDLELNFRRN